jgi:hypothetical protein
MYFVIGADGKEYGPFSPEEIQQWMSEGRANRYSRIRKDGETTYQALKDLPEFTDLRPMVPDPGGPPPRLTPEAIAADYLGRAGVIDVAGSFTRGWALVRDNAAVLVGASLLISTIIFGVALVPFVGWLAGLFINSALMGGLYYMFLRRIRGQEVSVGDAFAGFNAAVFTNLMLAGLVQPLLTFLGFLLCLLPGIYLAVGYLFVLPLIMDRQLDFWTAMEVSRRVVHEQWWTAFGFSLLLILALFAGVLACGVGLIIAIPVCIAAVMYAYEDLFGIQPR